MQPEPEPETKDWQAVAAAQKAARNKQLAAQLNGVRSGELDPATVKAVKKAKLDSIRSGETDADPAEDVGLIKDAKRAELAAIRAGLRDAPAAGAKLFVRGIADRFESPEALLAVFSQYGRCDPEHPPRVRLREDKHSWAVVTMQSEEDAEAALAATDLPSPLSVSKYSQDQANKSTGAMASMRSLVGIDSAHMTDELTEALDKLRRQAVGEVEEQPVVDWTLEPDIDIARRYRLLYQAGYIIATTDSGIEERQPVQRALQPKDENGWLKTDGVRKYRACDASPEDLGRIGGTGLRVYFLVLRTLSLILLACGLISLPAMFAYSTQEMYDQPEAEIYAHLAGPARIGVGNIRVSDTDIEAGKSGVLWLSSFTNAVVSIVLTLFTLWIGQHMKSISATVDLESVTMADYTVQIKPIHDELWEAFTVNDKVTREDQKIALQQCVKESLESAIPGSSIAKIGGEVAIWIAWNEEARFELWEQKRVLLLELEAALKTRRTLAKTEGTRIVKVVQRKLEKLNAKLESVSARHHHGKEVTEDASSHTPVVVFATFENSASFDEALDIKQLKVQSVQGQGETAELTVSITGAPEPETLLWKNLQYTEKQRWIRAATIVLCTIFVLLVGVWCITVVGKLRARNSYTNNCKWVIGPRKNTTAEEICPHALDASSIYPLVYRDSYQSLSATLEAAEFPRITTLGVDPTNLPRGRICEPVRSHRAAGARYVNWPGWNVNGSGEAATASCHRVDSPPADLFSGGLWFLVGTLIVVLLNQALKYAVIFTAPFAKPHTVSLQMMATATRIFLCQFINYIVLVFLLNSSLLVFNDIPGDRYDNINSKWYALVATPMLESLLIQFFVVPCEHVFFASGLLEFAMRTFSGTSTQNLLNQALAPTPRDLAVGYGEILLALAVTLVYAPALPLLYFVAAAGFAMRFWIEKWADLTVYKRPPLLDGNLFKSFDQLLMFLVVVQVMLATHYVSAAGGLHPEVPRKHDTFKPHVLPMFVTFLFVCIAFATKILTKVSVGCHRRLLALPCGKYCLHDRENVTGEKLPPFSEAYLQGLLINEDDDFFADELEDLLDLSLAFAEKLAERAELDGDPQLYNDLREVILTHSHKAEVHETHAVRP